jgi:hypothetical protein
VLARGAGGWLVVLMDGCRQRMPASCRENAGGDARPSGRSGARRHPSETAPSALSGSSQPLREDAEQNRCGLLVQPQHTTVRGVRVKHDDSVFPGYQKIRESHRAVRLTGGHDHATVASPRAVLGALKRIHRWA